MDERIIEVEVRDHWLPPYRIEYDGKYITLFGKDKNYTMFTYDTGIVDYEEMVLHPVVNDIQEKNLSPQIVDWDDKIIKIKLITNWL